MTTIRIPTPLRPYTGGNSAVAGDGATVGEAPADLARLHPQLRPHPHGHEIAANLPQQRRQTTEQAQAGADLETQGVGAKIDARGVAAGPAGEGRPEIVAPRRARRRRDVGPGARRRRAMQCQPEHGPCPENAAPDAECRAGCPAVPAARGA